MLPSLGVLLEMQHPKSCPCFGVPWAGWGWGGSRDALGAGEHWEGWTGAGREWKGILGRQMERESEEETEQEQEGLRQG